MPDGTGLVGLAVRLDAVVFCVVCDWGGYHVQGVDDADECPACGGDIAAVPELRTEEVGRFELPAPDYDLLERPDDAELN